MWSRPHVATAFPPISWLPAAFAPSARAAGAWPRAFSICSTTPLAPASSMSATTTRAPSRAIASADAAPIPEAAPVITATLPLSLIVRPPQRPSLRRQLGHRPRRELVARDQQRRDPRPRPLGEPLADPLARPAERDLVHERVRHRGLGLRAAARKVEVLDRLGGLLVAVAARDIVVEVAAARPHPPDVQRELRPHRLPARRDVVPHDDGDHRHDVEARGRAAAPAEPRVEPLPEHRDPPRREER